MAQPSQELKDILSHYMLGSPYDPSSVHSERWLIDHLVEMTCDFEIGTTSYDDLKRIFDQHKDQLNGFDLQHWIESKVAEGVYDDPYEDVYVD